MGSLDGSLKFGLVKRERENDRTMGRFTEAIFKLWEVVSAGLRPDECHQFVGSIPIPPEPSSPSCVGSSHTHWFPQTVHACQTGLLDAKLIECECGWLFLLHVALDRHPITLGISSSNLSTLEMTTRQG